jgi:hypothetical protein
MLKFVADLFGEAAVMIPIGLQSGQHVLLHHLQYSALLTTLLPSQLDDLYQARHNDLLLLLS